MSGVAAGSGGALAGVRVLDLTQMLAGPYCTMMLADQGATVTKVEPIGGDPTRRFGPFPPGGEELAGGYGGYFQSTNRDKRSIAIDLAAPEGKAVLRALARGSDVVVENFRAGVMDLGLSYESLARDNERLVYAAIRGFGDPRTGDSPYMHWPAFDVVAQAMGGAMGVTGSGPGSPLKIGPGIGDVFPAAMAAFAILAALRHAERTGAGQFVDVAMYDGMLALCERVVYQRSYTGVAPGPEGNNHPLLCPFGMFRARDGHVTIACPRDTFWRELSTIMGRAELADDPRFQTNAARLAHAAPTNAAVQAWTERLSKQEIGARLGGRVPFGPVNTADDIFADPHVLGRGLLAEVEHPGSGKRVSIAASPIRMTLTPSRVRRRAPLLGEDTDAVLQALGTTPDDIAALRGRGVVR